jgi:hypothetical protein
MLSSMLPVDKNKGKAHNLLNFYSGCLDFMFSKYSQVLFAFMVVAILFAFSALVVSAHQVTAILGTVNCQGNYSITVTGDVYDGIHLIVTLGGTTIYDQAQNDTSATQTFGPFTGTGAAVGESIMAQTSDGSQTSSELTLTGDPCSTSTPTPTPTCTPTPTVTPTVTPTEIPTPTTTPSNPGGPGDNKSDNLGCSVRDCSNHPSAQPQVLGASTKAVLGLSTTSGEENFLPQLIQLFGAITSGGLGLVFFKKNA